MYTAKQAIMLKEHDPGSRPTSSTWTSRRGARTTSSRAGAGGLRRSVLRAREPRLPKGERYVVQGYDGLAGRPVERGDLVVLANGMTSARGAVDLMQKLSISYDGYGFVNEASQAAAVETNTAGIYLAGCAPAQGHPRHRRQARPAAKVAGSRPAVHQPSRRSRRCSRSAAWPAPLRGGLPYGA